MFKAGAPSLRPGLRLHGSCKSSFAGRTAPFRPLTASPKSGRPSGLCVQATKICQLTGKRSNNGFTVSFSHKRNHKLQEVNLQYKQVYWPQMERMVTLRISTKAMKTIEKKGLQNMAKEAGLDLMKLPYIDCSKNRQEWLAKQPKVPAQPKQIAKTRRMKNPEKLAASKKRPLKAAFLLDGAGGRVILTRDPRYVKEYQE